ncbi:UvrD-helicase domain-containing protein [Rothia sp. AR01]|uniref:DNA 3'-5' helicase n=1 Tax=Rothia santali TaxID=2949643 RepID=A0A9X2KHH9_9MICC|nr:UvrD-helicase domain-containing protein [Rothia santali]MCP3424809.1 UvrD-helicase domain-containing protein [Rothia santali]
MREWRPSRWARLFGAADGWALRVDGPYVEIDRGAEAQRHHAFVVRDRSTDKRLFWYAVVLPIVSGPIRLNGLSGPARRSLEQGLQASLDEYDRLKGIVERFNASSALISAWWTRVQADRLEMAERWLPREVLRGWQQDRPDPDPSFLDVYRETHLAEFLRQQPQEVHAALLAWQHEDLEASTARRNQAFLAAERNRLAEFFDTIEKSPLTEEQIESVICFDNRVRVIASAGSGKTSTMVARAAYTLRRELAPPGGILMLAFNKKAAEELAERLVGRLGGQGEGVSSHTFHSFGMRVIGEATGRKPSVADDITKDSGLKRVERIVDELREHNGGFRRDWDLFRLVFGRDLPELGADEIPEDWDHEAKRSGFRTLNGEVVRSQEERMIADWLFYHGVAYQYERPYAYDTADAQHGQYRPDFYYPDIDAYHEHWAIGSDGRPPASFRGYAEGMAWKRQIHRGRGTTLLETTSAGVRDGSAFEELAHGLSTRGIVLDENPYRKSVGEEPMEDRDLINLVRTFMVHAKSNRLESSVLDARARTTSGLPLRARLFLRIHGRIAQQWQDGLQREGLIDFEDMLNQASDLIEAGRWQSPFEVVMVDEMQDSSSARARLVQALVSRPHTYLYAVGDDWQSVNRFAGADLSVITGFDQWFGEGPTVWLRRTFRSPQSICDVASSFVSKNPDQIAKTVVSDRPEEPPTLRAVAVEAKSGYGPLVHSYLDELDRSQAQRGQGGATVLILGRYRKTLEDFEAEKAHGWEHLEIELSTVHSAKGKEADYVVIADLNKGGFPSTIQDDPLLELAMPRGEDYPSAEERRLFYVALTRARRAVLMLTVARRESPFLLELIDRKQVSLENVRGEIDNPVMCPTCGVNRMLVRKGPKGDFYGCSAFPGCRGTKSLSKK